MVDSKYLLYQQETVIEALRRINSLRTSPLVLFVVDEDQKVVGTLTDGDVRRSLIDGAKLDDAVCQIMHRDFHYIRQGDPDMVMELHNLRESDLRLIPILDETEHLVDIIDLERFRTSLPIDAVLMAGGKGERMRPLTEKTPKPLLPVGDKAIIDHNVDRIIQFGIKHIFVTVNYLKEQIEDHFAAPHYGVQVKCVRETKFLGTIGSIKLVKEFYNDTILVMNSDLFTNINFEDFYLHFKEHNAEMSVAALPYSVSIPYGVFDLEGREIRGLVEKPTYNYYVNAGIYLLKRSVLDEIPEDTMFHSTDLIEQLIAKRKKVIRFPLNGAWIDIGNPQEYKKANELVKHLY